MWPKASHRSASNLCSDLRGDSTQWIIIPPITYEASCFPSGQDARADQSNKGLSLSVRELWLDSQPVSLWWHRVTSTVPSCHFKPLSFCPLHSCISPLGHIIALGSLTVPNSAFTEPQSINVTSDCAQPSALSALTATCVHVAVYYFSKYDIYQQACCQWTTSSSIKLLDRTHPLCLTLPAHLRTNQSHAKRAEPQSAPVHIKTKSLINIKCVMWKLNALIFQSVCPLSSDWGHWQLSKVSPFLTAFNSREVELFQTPGYYAFSCQSQVSASVWGLN